MDDLFKGLVFLGGTPLYSINDNSFKFEYLVTQIESQRITVNHLPESKRILHNGIVRDSLEPSRILLNGAVRVFVRTQPNFTQWSSSSIRQNYAWLHTINHKGIVNV